MRGSLRAGHPDGFEAVMMLNGEPCIQPRWFATETAARADLAPYQDGLPAGGWTPVRWSP